MANHLNSLIFGIYPYIALVVLVVGSIIRYDREPYSWRAGSTQLLRRKQLIMGSVLFHVGILIVLFGHLVGLLTPIALFDMLGISHSFKQMMAIVVGGTAGGLALIGATLLVHRRLADARVRATSSFADTAIIIILWIQLVLGLLTIPISMGHLDGHEMVKFMSWALGIFTFDTNATSHVASANPVFKLHIFLGLTLFVLFPFTRLVHMLSAPVRYFWRPGYQIVRTKARAARARTGAPA
ncbi:MAG: nitrate reductase gamma subunit [Gammaproteobacteria bacterium]|jgi:nitrate reductase gamma subunit